MGRENVDFKIMFMLQNSVFFVSDLLGFWLKQKCYKKKKSMNNKDEASTYILPTVISS